MDKNELIVRFFGKLIFIGAFILLMNSPIEAQSPDRLAWAGTESFKEDTIGINSILKEEFLLMDEHGNELSFHFVTFEGFLLLVFKSTDGVFLDPALPMLEKSYDGKEYLPAIFSGNSNGGGITSTG